MTIYWYDWVPDKRALGLDFSDPSFLLLCCSIGLLVLLSCWRRWASLVDKPWVFALVHGTPFFIFTFQESLGDSGQVMGYVAQRYHMSEPGATFIHHWFYRLLGGPFDMSPKTAIALSSRFAGVVYLWLTALVSNQLLPDFDARRRLLFRLFYVVAGSSLLFYGYVENPPIALPAEQAWVLATLLFLGAPSTRRNIVCGMALAGATLAHGRAGFLAPALAVGCILPYRTLMSRFLGLVVGGASFVVTLGLVVGVIFLFDFEAITGNHWGNTLGGGNRRQFVELSKLLGAPHIHMVLLGLWMAAGVQAPLALCSLKTLFVKPRSLVVLWGMAYAIAGLFFVYIWEFDYGFFMDWDLPFSGAGGILLLSALALVRSPIPQFLLVPVLCASAVLSFAFSSVVNGGHLSWNWPPTAVQSVQAPNCHESGLKKVHYSDIDFSTPVTQPQGDVPDMIFSISRGTHPLNGKPLGGRYAGFVKIPAAGKYRFHLRAVGNLKFTVGGQTLYKRWTGFEWQIFSERAIRFPAPGWYPIEVDFFSTIAEIYFKVELESASLTRRALTRDELCFE